MFERFTDRARDVVVTAQDEARSRGNDSIETGHLLIAVLRQGDGLGLRVLESLGVRPQTAIQQAGDALGTGQNSDPAHLPFTDGARQALRLGYQESLKLGHGHVGTEHILLGVVAEGSETGALVLAGLGVTLNRARQQLREITGYQGAGQAAKGRLLRRLRGR